MISFSGTVVHGKGEARGIGYPTANLMYACEERPGLGVWTCRVELEGEVHHGLMIVGMWELESGLPSVEVYLLDVNKEFYDKSLAVTPLIKLRDLMQFDSVDALVVQIKQDITDARAVFGV